MSNLRNLSDSIAAARLRAARSGDALHSLLSPPSVGSTSTGSGACPSGLTFASLGHQMTGLSMVPSVEGEGGPGEFSFCAAGGGGPKELSISGLEPDTIAHLCKGTVNGGVKFCLLPSDQCTIGAHSKKVSVDGSHVYINAGCNAAYTNPHIEAVALGPDLNVFLGELRLREDWLHLFQVY
jgi:hypothetical protein